MTGTRREVVVPVDGGELRYLVDGETLFGPEQVMLDQDDDLLAGTPWADEGYGIASFLGPDDQRALVDGLTDLIARCVEHHLGRAVPAFALETYHRTVTSDALHQEIVGDLFAGGIAVGDLPIPVEAIEARVSELCGVAVSTRCPDLDASVVFVRLVRPGAIGDHNPPHRDVWLDHLRHAVNGYVPLAGSTAETSLGLVPGSHRWPESAIERTASGARLAGIAYEVPAVVAAEAPLRLQRPDPGPGEILLFSPYLVHGGGINLSVDRTRASLELRFWRR